MSRRGNYHDDVVAENFFQFLKRDGDIYFYLRIDPAKKEELEEVARSLLKTYRYLWIRAWCNKGIWPSTVCFF